MSQLFIVLFISGVDTALSIVSYLRCVFAIIRLIHVVCNSLPMGNSLFWLAV